MDVSILIVHYNTPKLLRQTLKGIFSSNISVPFEVIVVDNNPSQRIQEQVEKEFPQVKVFVSDSNIGFGCGMNLAMKHASGRYYFVFNPDIALFEGTIEKLVQFMDENKDVGMVGPQLLNPDRSLQHSCYRFMDPKIILYRRIPLLKNLRKAKEAVSHYLMEDWDHKETREVDYLLGAAMFVRKEAVDDVGVFDPEYFVYFEDQDWCRRFWKAGWKILYYPETQLVHYHRRETAEGNFLKQLFNKLTRIQIQSALYYYKKYKGEENPHGAFNKLSS